MSKKDKPAPKKRGRKPKKKQENVPKPPPKKRGRKPKGGKIIKKNTKINENSITPPPNVVLQLKCSSNDLLTQNNYNITDYNPNVENPIAYNINTNTKMYELQYEEIKTQEKPIQNNNIILKKEKPKQEECVNTKEIWDKLNKLKRNLRTNNVSDKRSACFWCTYEFDNPAVHIPKQYNGDCLEVYGCFCSPECALSYLKNEQIDDYEKNIKPAPNPHYTLDKYYGNLSIQQYRKLLSKERIYMVVDKPMTKILPELYEENNEIPNVYNNLLDTKQQTNVNNFRLKRSQTKQTKSNALSNTFNL
jgi:hypothetical protein